MKLKKHFLKPLCMIMSIVMLVSCVPFVSYAKNEIVISNPYENINWNSINQYKTALHTHTNASDGRQTLRQSLERHCQTGFDIVSITDHGTVDRSWSDKKANSQLIYGLYGLIGKNDGQLDYIGTEGTFADGTSYKMESKNGDDYLVTSNGKEILKIPYGIENNAISINAHVNSWFADFSRNLPSDYVDAVAGVDAAGGLSIINHPGEYSNARYELFQKDAYNLLNPSYNYLFQKFYGLINEYDSCLGIDINSKGDDRTRYDRKLWDLMLVKAAKSGKTVYAIASSDAHEVDVIDTGCIYILADDKTSANVRSALENGEFFASSTCIGNYDELVQIAESIKEYYGETALYNELQEIIAKYDADRSEKVKSSDKGNVKVQYKAIDDDGYFNKSSRPQITSINVDDAENTISINTNNALVVRWISDGKLIATTKAGESTIDLDNYKGVKGYVRAEVFGEGGVLYTQSFTLNADTATEKENSYVNFGILDIIFPELNLYLGLLVRIIKNLF